MVIILFSVISFLLMILAYIFSSHPSSFILWGLGTGYPIKFILAPLEIFIIDNFFGGKEPRQEYFGLTFTKAWNNFVVGGLWGLSLFLFIILTDAPI